MNVEKTAVPLKFTSTRAAADHILKNFPQRLSLASPLGLGKPIQLLNDIYDSIAQDPKRTLEIYTALSLVPPEAKSDVEKRFLNPFLDRHFGASTPKLHYAQDMRKSKLPSNIKVHEFYFQAAQYLKQTESQSSYLSVNYTHAARAIADRGIDVVLQMVSRNPENPNEFSLACNPDVTLDIADLHKERGQSLPIFAVVHPMLPFTSGDAIVPESFFAGIIDDPSVNHELFALPRGSVDAVDHMVGFHASRLVKDDGTLQIGIGSLSDALVHSMRLRHSENASYLKHANQVDAALAKPTRASLHDSSFEAGLYGTSEMVMDGFMHLRRSGILKRRIFDQDEKKMRYLHGAFFLGSKDFYAWLRDLKDEDRAGFSMTRVSKVNDLYDEHELALRRQRKNARFFNTCMKISILGGAVSDTLESGEVVSGVGGQYNFVAMSHELHDSHSVLMLRSTRIHKGKKVSNIVLDQPHETIPRHLRDIVVTEYGIACLRGRTDSEVIQSLIEISDSEFQAELVAGAKKNGKLDASYEVPEKARHNTPETIRRLIEERSAMFPEYPFGSDFTETELVLVKALGKLRSAGTFQKIATLFKGLAVNPSNFSKELNRMDLEKPKGLKQVLLSRVILGALS